MKSIVSSRIFPAIVATMFFFVLFCGQGASAQTGITNLFPFMTKPQAILSATTLMQRKCWAKRWA